MDSPSQLFQLSPVRTRNSIRDPLQNIITLWKARKCHHQKGERYDGRNLKPRQSYPSSYCIQRWMYIQQLSSVRIVYLSDLLENKLKCNLI
jgi:hypothetical protein